MFAPAARIIFKINLVDFTCTAVFKGADVVSALAVSPDGTTIYAAEGASSVLSISTANFAIQASYTIANATSIGSLTPSPDGTRLYVSDTNSYPLLDSIAALDLKSGLVVGSIVTNTGEGTPDFVVLSPDSSTLYTTSTQVSPSYAKEEIQVATSSLAVINSLPLTLPNPNSTQKLLAISSDGSLLAVSTFTPYEVEYGSSPTNVTLVSLPSLTVDAVAPVGNSCGISFTPNGNVAVTNCGTNTIQGVDLVSQRVTSWFDAGPDPENILVDANHSTIYSYNQYGVWAVGSSAGSVFSKLDANPTFMGSYPGYPLALSSDGSRIFAVTQNGVEIISASTHQALGLVATVPVALSASAVATSPDGQYLFVAGVDSTSTSQLLILNQASYAVQGEVAIPVVQTRPGFIICSPDSSTLFIFNNPDAYLASSELIVYSIALNTFSGQLNEGPEPLTGAALSSDGQALYYVYGNTLLMLNTTTLSQSSLESPVEPIGVAVTPDDTQLILTSSGDSIGVVDLANTENSYSISVGSSTGAVAIN